MIERNMAEYLDNRSASVRETPRLYTDGEHASISIDGFTSTSDELLGVVLDRLFLP